MKNKLKILLIKVPEIDFEEKNVNYSEILATSLPPIPLGIASLSAYLKERTGHEIHLFDIYSEGFDIYKKSQNSEIFRELIDKKINTVMPDVIGISSLMIINYKWVHYVTNIAKKINPQVKNIVGGGYASLMPYKVLDDINVDFIATGEGEETLLTVINENFDKEKLAHLEGAGFRNERGKVVINEKSSFNEDPSALPFYDWEGINLETYLKRTKNRSVSYITSRGCPFGCSFCSTHLMWGKRFRPLSAKRILDEIDYLVSKYSIGHIEFRDDNLALDKKRTFDIFNGLIERKYNLQWNCPNAMAVTTLDQKVLEVIKRSGCSILTIAIESGSERILKDVIHKPINKDKVREVVRVAKDIGLRVETAFIIGFPGETREDIEKTRNFVLELQCDWNQISIATPFPGTEMYDLCEENNYFVDSNIDLERFRYGFANIRTEDFDEKWIKEKAYDINIEANFLKNPNIDNDPKCAILYFKDRLSNYPKHLIGIFCLAYVYKLVGEEGNARETLKRACDLMKNEIDIYEIYKKYIDRSNPIFKDYFRVLDENKAIG